MLLLIPWLACSTREVNVRGKVDTIRSAENLSRGPFADGHVDIRDENGDDYGGVDIGDDGHFRVNAPAAQTIYADISGPDHGVATFTGVAGTDPILKVPDGIFYGVRLAQIEAWHTEFAGCPGADASGGIVTGIVRVENLTDPNTGENPMVINATATVTNESDGSVLTACYRDNDGVYDPEATVNGNTGFFIIFGVPPGLATLTVTYTAFTDPIANYLTVWMPDTDNAVAPRWPVSVEFTPGA
jgi:hypothetical protein